MHLVNDNNTDGVSKIVAKGVSKTKLYYVIMEKYGHDLW
jgi:hypothetical protein